MKPEINSGISERTVIIVACAIVLVIMIFQVIKSTPSESAVDMGVNISPVQPRKISDPEIQRYLKHNAFSISKVYLKKTVNDEDAFEAPHAATSVISTGKNNREFVVNSYYTAKNLFNATVKTKYSMGLTYSGPIDDDKFSETDFWHIDELYINGKRVK